MYCILLQSARRKCHELTIWYLISHRGKHILHSYKLYYCFILQNNRLLNNNPEVLFAWDFMDNVHKNDYLQMICHFFFSFFLFLLLTLTFSGRFLCPWVTPRLSILCAFLISPVFLSLCCYINYISARCLYLLQQISDKERCSASFTILQRLKTVIHYTAMVLLTLQFCKPLDSVISADKQTKSIPSHSIHCIGLLLVPGPVSFTLFVQIHFRSLMISLGGKALCALGVTE